MMATATGRPTTRPAPSAIKISGLAGELALSAGSVLVLVETTLSWRACLVLMRLAMEPASALTILKAGMRISIARYSSEG